MATRERRNPIRGSNLNHRFRVHCFLSGGNGFTGCVCARKGKLLRRIGETLTRLGEAISRRRLASCRAAL